MRAAEGGDCGIHFIQPTNRYSNTDRIKIRLSRFGDPQAASHHARVVRRSRSSTGGHTCIMGGTSPHGRGTSATWHCHVDNETNFQVAALASRQHPTKSHSLAAAAAVSPPVHAVMRNMLGLNVQGVAGQQQACWHAGTLRLMRRVCCDVMAHCAGCLRPHR